MCNLLILSCLIEYVETRTRPEFWFRSCPVPVPVEFGLVPVPVRYRWIWPVPDRYNRNFFSESVYKVAKRTIENKYSSTSENVDIDY